MRSEHEAGDRWVESGYAFTNPVGEPLNQDYLTGRFAHLVRRSGLPPVRLHDLRHGAPPHSLMRPGPDLKTQGR
jgi:hypothetical protein